MDGLWPDVLTKLKDKTAFNEGVACNINTKQQQNFWFSLCDTVLQFSHQGMLSLHNTRLASIYCYRVRIHRKIVTLET